MTLLPINGTDPDLGPAIFAPLDNSITPSPFLWGQGGAKLTPDELARRQKVASALMQSNYSPVANIWQGLGRVADNVMGAIDQKKLDKQASSANDDRNSQIAALLGQGNQDLVPGLSSNDAVVSALAGDVFKSRQPKQIAPNEFDRALIGAGIDPHSAQGQALYAQRANTLAMPSPQFVPDGLGGGQWVVPPNGGIPQPSQVPQAPVGKLTPIEGGGASNSVGGF